MFGLNKTTQKFCDLKGKVAIVTGAKQGMGRAHALILARSGAKVVLLIWIWRDASWSLMKLKKCEAKQLL